MDQDPKSSDDLPDNGEFDWDRLYRPPDGVFGLLYRLFYKEEAFFRAERWLFRWLREAPLSARGIASLLSRNAVKAVRWVFVRDLYVTYPDDPYWHKSSRLRGPLQPLARLVRWGGVRLGLFLVCVALLLPTCLLVARNEHYFNHHAMPANIVGWWIGVILTVMFGSIIGPPILRRYEAGRRRAAHDANVRHASALLMEAAAAIRRAYDLDHDIEHRSFGHDEPVTLQDFMRLHEGPAPRTFPLELREQLDYMKGMCWERSSRIRSSTPYTSTIGPPSKVAAYWVAEVIEHANACDEWNDMPEVAALNPFQLSDAIDRRYPWASDVDLKRVVLFGDRLLRRDASARLWTATRLEAAIESGLSRSEMTEFDAWGQELALIGHLLEAIERLLPEQPPSESRRV